MAEATLKMLLLGEDRSAGRTLRGVGDDADRTASKFQGFAKTASVALAGGLLVAGAAALKMGKAAAEDEAAASKLAQTMHKVAGASDAQVASTEKWITAQGKALGVSDDQLRPALSKLVVATHDVGKAQELASLAMDVSVGKGKDLGAVSEALAKAQNGNIGALGRLGIATKDADGKTKSLHQITKELADTYGGAASTHADTAAGKQERLTVALSEAGETIGYKLLPFMLDLTDAATAAIDWMTEHGRLVGILAGVLGGLAGFVLAVSAAVRVWTAVQTVLNVVLSANPIGLVVLAIAGLVAAFILAYQKSETFRDIVNGAWHAVATAFQAVWNNFLAPVFQLYGKAIGALLNTWASLLDLLGRVPGFGWAKDLADKLHNAADAANDLDLKIRHIPDEKNVKVNISEHLVKGVGGVPVYNTTGHNAIGTPFFGGGATWVGEREPELLELPRGSRITPMSRLGGDGGGGGDLGTVTLVVKGEDGRTLEQKFIKFQRDQGGRPLAFVTS